MAGAVKETIGKLAGDAKLQVDGRAEQVAGRAQNLAGSVKDTLKG